MTKEKGAELAVLGGSNAYDIINRKTFAAERIGRIDTPYGPSEPVYLMLHENTPFYFMSRHGESAFRSSPAFVNYRANIYALKDLGTKAILSWSEAAAVNLKYLVGQFVIADDIIDETRNRESSFFRFRGLGMIRQHPVFCETMRTALRSVLVNMSANFADKATYVVTEGPRRETPAEVRKFAAYGADLVGMTLAPEVFLAKELEMCYATFCYVGYYAEGVKERKFAPGHALDGLVTRKEINKVKAAVAELPRIIRHFIRQYPHEHSVCHCRELMRRYKTHGVIGENWREWFKP